MKILKSTRPIVVELSSEDIRTMHLSLDRMKIWLKYGTKGMDKTIARRRLRAVNEMRTLVDLLMNA